MCGVLGFFQFLASLLAPLRSLWQCITLTRRSASAAESVRTFLPLPYGKERLPCLLGHLYHTQDFSFCQEGNLKKYLEGILLCSNLMPSSWSNFSLVFNPPGALYPVNSPFDATTLKQGYSLGCSFEAMILPMARGEVLQTLASSLYVATFPFGIFFNNKIALCILQNLARLSFIRVVCYIPLRPGPRSPCGLPLYSSLLKLQ